MDDRVGELDAGKICSKFTNSPSSHSFTIPCSSSCSFSKITSSKGDPHVNEQNRRMKNSETLSKSIQGRNVLEKTEIKVDEKDIDSFYETGSEELDSYLYIDEDEDKDHHHFSKYYDGRNYSFRETGRGDEEERCHSFRRVNSCRESGNHREGSRIKGRKALGMLINGPSSPPSSNPSSPPRERTRSPTVTTNRAGISGGSITCSKVNRNMNGIKQGNNYEPSGGKCDCNEDRSPSSTGTMDRFKSGYAAFRRSFDPRIVTFNCCSPSPPSFTPSPSQSDLDSPSLPSNPLTRTNLPTFNGERKVEKLERGRKDVSTQSTTSSRQLNQNHRILNRNNNFRNSQQQQGNGKENDERRRINPNSSPTSFSLTSASFSTSLSSSPSDHPSSSMNDSSSSSSSNPKSKFFHQFFFKNTPFRITLIFSLRRLQ